MAGLRITSNSAAIIASHRNLQARQLPFAFALALTRTVGDIQKNEKKRQHRVLDRPTPFTQSGVAIRKASKRKLIASVYYKPIQAGYLRRLETGGVRRPKGRALLLPVRQRVNKYGNLPRGTVARMRARPDTFSGTVNGTAGLWQRMKSGKLKLLVSYQDIARYEPRLRFRSSAMKTGKARFPIQLRRALDHALRTAR